MKLVGLEAMADFLFCSLPARTQPLETISVKSSEVPGPGTLLCLAASRSEPNVKRI